MTGASDWPEIPYPAWRETADALRLWTQVVGKIRLVQTPWINHSWHVTLRVSARGLATPLMTAGGTGFDIEFDFVADRLRIRTTDGQAREVALKPQSVRTFHVAVLAALAELGLAVSIDPMPNEIADAVPFDRDDAPRPYDADAARRFWRALVQAERSFTRFRAGFIGKCSPVHVFWGSFDLAVTRFSGRRAPLHPGGIPHLPDAVAQEAYSHEVSSAGFWAGGGGIDFPAFYSYAYPAPEGFAAARVAPGEAFFHQGLGEFLLPYDAVRTASDPDATLMAFLETTYAAAADAARWDRAALERRSDQPRPPF
jgi:hypothetical protein